MKIYGTLKDIRLLNVKIFQNEEKTPIFEGKIEELPEELKKLKYYHIELENPVNIYVCNEILKKIKSSYSKV